jgi:hypothetical protein
MILILNDLAIINSMYGLYYSKEEEIIIFMTINLYRLSLNS